MGLLQIDISNKLSENDNNYGLSDYSKLKHKK